MLAPDRLLRNRGPFTAKTLRHGGFAESRPWLLADGCWLLADDCWLLTVGWWLLADDWWL